MAENKKCPYCGSVLKSGENCGCPGAVREQKKFQALRERIADSCYIRLEKTSGREEFMAEMVASSTTALINGLAILMLKSAAMTEASVDSIYAKVATVLFRTEEEA